LILANRRLDFSTESATADIFLSKTSTNVLFINSSSTRIGAVSLVVNTIQTSATNLNIAGNSKIFSVGVNGMKFVNATSNYVSSALKAWKQTIFASFSCSFSLLLYTFIKINYKKLKRNIK
jgi:hypothetical protein